MSTPAAHDVNKTGWPDGPWMTEPDRLQWTDEATGLPCLIVRNRYGVLCGYVAVADGHRYFEKCYSDIDEGVEVHGGLTYSNFCQGHICHVPEPGAPDRVWWLGFDCGHGGDFTPGLGMPFTFGYETYRDIDYVRGECARLAAQLRGVS